MVCQQPSGELQLLKPRSSLRGTPAFDPIPAPPACSQYLLTSSTSRTQSESSTQEWGEPISQGTGCLWRVP